MINEEAKAFIAENYETMNPKEIAEIVGRSQDWGKARSQKDGHVPRERLSWRKARKLQRMYDLLQ